MSVLSEADRAVVKAAIAKARAPRVRMTRTQALRPHRRPVRSGAGTQAGVADRAPATPFIGLCVFCGCPAEVGSTACVAHADLPELDARSSFVVTRNTTALARTPFPGSASEGIKEGV